MVLLLIPTQSVQMKIIIQENEGIAWLFPEKGIMFIVLKLELASHIYNCLLYTSDAADE